MGGGKITKIHLKTKASGEPPDEETLEQAKEQCPISVLLKGCPAQLAGDDVPSNLNNPNAGW